MTINNFIYDCIQGMVAYDDFYGYFTSTLDVKINRNVSTAAVTIENNSFVMYANPDFFDTLSVPEKRAVIKHEILHLIFFHLTMHDLFADQTLANIAMDLEVNQWINDSSTVKDTYILPKDAVTLDAIKQKYPELKHLKPKAGCVYYYEELSKLSQAKQKQMGSGYCSDGEGEDGQNPGQGGGGFKPVDEHPWPKELDALSKQVLEQQISDFLTKVSSNYRGTVPGEYATYLDAFKNKKPEFNWKKHLRRFVSNSPEIMHKQTRLRPNILMEDRPVTKLTFKSKILCAIDTSGSVSDSDLQEFMTEIFHMTRQNYAIDIMCVDTQIHPPKRYKGEDKVAMLGRGGTYFTPTIEYFNNTRQYSMMIYFTDGYAECPPRTNKPMLWVITKGGSAKAIESHPAPKLLMKPE